eukprot:8425050-Pyramimonas_sp.AAC.1
MPHPKPRMGMAEALYLTAEPKLSVHPRYCVLDSGFVCLDGSVVDPGLLSFTRAGYGVVAVDLGGN